MREVIKRALGLTVVLLLASMVFSACAGQGRTVGKNYYDIKPMIQNAVTAYAVSHNGELPPATSNTTYNIVTEAGGAVPDCLIIDICAILGVGDLLRTEPDGCAQFAGDDNDNFDNGGCVPTGPDQHYIWVMDTSGNVYSMCDEDLDGSIEGTENVDGFHGVGNGYSEDFWP